MTDDVKFERRWAHSWRTYECTDEACQGKVRCDECTRLTRERYDALEDLARAAMAVVDSDDALAREEIQVALTGGKVDLKLVDQGLRADGELFLRVAIVRRWLGSDES